MEAFFLDSISRDKEAHKIKILRNQKIQHKIKQVSKCPVSSTFNA